MPVGIGADARPHPEQRPRRATDTRWVELYDRLGRTYGATRRADPRIGAQLRSALGDARSVVNVGAGTGSYEPPPTVVAVEPSPVMIDQRPPGSAPAVRGVAEALPLADNCVDAAMAVLSVHHWTDVAAGIAELTRVARCRVVLLSWFPEVIADFWLLSEYLPEAAAVDAAQSVPVQTLTGLLPNPRVFPVPVPHDCIDGFGAAFWRRPEAYLQPEVRAGMSMLAKTGDSALESGLSRLAEDLRTGTWHRRHADLLTRESLDVGYCLIVAEL